MARDAQSTKWPCAGFLTILRRVDCQRKGIGRQVMHIAAAVEYRVWFWVLESTVL